MILPADLPKFPRDEVALLSAAHWAWRGFTRPSPHGDASQFGCGGAALSYLVRNVSRMQNGTFRKQGSFIGSGVIEAGCKTVMGSWCK